MFKIFRFKIVTAYVLREFLVTFFISFLFFFIIFFINHILVNIKPLLERNIPFDLVAMMMITFFPVIMIFSLPFGVMLATLMIMGRFSSDNEIIAFRALGFNMMQVFGPIFITALIITITTFIINDRLVPMSWHQQRVTMRKIMQIKPTLDFKSRTVKKHEDKVIYTNVVNDTNIEGLFIIDKDENNSKRIITAKTADIFSPKDRKGVIELKMNNAMIQFENKDRPSEFNFGYSDSISYFIDLQDFDDTDPTKRPGTAKSTFENYQDVRKYKKIFRSDKKALLTSYLRLREETKFTLMRNEQNLKNNISSREFVDNLKNLDNNLPVLLKQKREKVKNTNLNISLIEFYRKFANPLACIIFAIFAAPVGIYSRRAGFQIGFILGLFLTAFYWFSFSGCIILGRKFLLKPFIAMSLPNLIFLIIGSIALTRRLRE